jgi:AcrR family transcriptional regulator
MLTPDLRRASPAAEFQRARIIAATIAVASEHDIAGVTVSRVITKGHLSRRTFYELFDDCADCLCAAYEQILDSAASHAIPAYEAESRWVERVRAGLRAALEFFDEQPQLARLCFLQAPAAGERTLTSRARLISSLAEVLNEDYAAERPSRVLPELASKAVVGGVLEILHARLLADRRIELAALSGQLMAVIVLPFLGPAAARRELARRPPPSSERLASDSPLIAPVRPATRLTYRTLLTLSTISQWPGLSNRQISDRVGIKDQGQISKLLSRLCELRLIENGGAGQPHGAANAWRLAPSGRRLIQSVGRRRLAGRLSEDGELLASSWQQPDS